ncbi:hypothetical protein GCM10020331_070200 [Ectobacillus funiculus]
MKFIALTIILESQWFKNLEALGFANPILQALWNNEYIANVQITASETVGVETRAGYYDQAGAIRDMFQKSYDANADDDSDAAAKED